MRDGDIQRWAGWVGTTCLLIFLGFLVVAPVIVWYQQRGKGWKRGALFLFAASVCWSPFVLIFLFATGAIGDNAGPP